MNVVILSGNLARDPEVRFTPTGKAVTEATVCVSERWTDESGHQREKTAFVALVFWGPRGEAFAKHHRKGARASIRGRLVQESWDDKTTGKKQTKTKVQVEEWEFADRKPADGNQPESTAQPPRRFNDRSPIAPVSSEWPDFEPPKSAAANTNDADDFVPF